MVKEESLETLSFEEKENGINAGNGKEVSTSEGASSIYYLHCFLLFCGRFLNKILDAYNGLFDITQKDKVKIYRNISTHYINKGQHKKGLEYLKEWSKLESSNPDAYYQLAIALSASGNKKSALSVLNKVLKLNPQHKGAIFRKSTLQINSKNYKEAVEDLEVLVKLAPDNAKVYYLLGVAYEGINEVEKAITSMQKAVDMAPNELRYNQHLGFLNVRKDDHKTAAKFFTKVMEIERESTQEDEE
ncbi:MAG: tetratricopeptide repeat protein [Desulfobacterales bacterium]|nr:tetratricopeptide repeat protein [Desulfobacterales bacterium]